MKLYTLDEARTVFVRSSLALFEAVDAPDEELCQFIGARGSCGSLPRGDRKRVFLHWDLLGDLSNLGYGWAIADEIEGFISCVEVVGGAGACALVSSELGQCEDAGASAETA